MGRIKEELKALGITNPGTIYLNISYDELYKHETMPHLEGYEKALHKVRSFISRYRCIHRAFSKTNMLSWMTKPETLYGGMIPIKRI